jgi:hypothetical protein
LTERYEGLSARFEEKRVDAAKEASAAENRVRELTRTHEVSLETEAAKAADLTKELNRVQAANLALESELLRLQTQLDDSTDTAQRDAAGADARYREAESRVDAEIKEHLQTKSKLLYTEKELCAA